MFEEDVKKPTIYQKAGIDLNVSRVSKVLNMNCINAKLLEKISEIKLKIEEVKKEGKPPVPNPNFVKLSKEATEEEKEQRRLAKSEYEKQVAEYDRFSSERYKNSLLSYNLYKRINHAIDLMTRLANPELKESVKENLNTELNKVLESFKTGGVGKGLSWELKFSSLYPNVPTDLEGLKNLAEQINTEYKDTNELFRRKDELSKHKFRFSKPVKATVAYFIQQSITDILKHAITDCKKSEVSKTTLRIENFRSSVLRKSEYRDFYIGLDSSLKLAEYLERKYHYELDIAKIKALKFSGKMPISSFEENEEKGRHMKYVEKNKKGDTKKHWHGLNVMEGVSFVSCVYNLFLKAKKEMNFKGTMCISSRAKEFISNLIVQFLMTIARKIELRRIRKSIIKVDSQEDKSLKYEDMIVIFKDYLVNSNTDVANEFIQSGLKVREVVMNKK